MKKSIIIIAPLALIACTSLPGDVDVSEAPALADLRWLAGSWSGPMWGGQFEAFYSSPEGGKILSFSELKQGGKSVYFEFERFETKGAGKGRGIVLTPHPKGKAAASFELVTLDRKAKRAVFENPKKDYPTRIVYHRVAGDRLEITLSDPHGKSGKTETFKLKRTKHEKAPGREAGADES